MKTVRRCLLVVLLALGAHPAIAAPGVATLIAPSGEVVGTTIAFSWQSVPESTWYLFWLGKGTPTAFVVEQWYTAEQAGCAGGGTCTITITPPINAGSHVWFIQTWAAGVTGPWSAGKVFGVKDPASNWSSKLPDARRFTLVLNDEGVLDNETSLVWQRSLGLPSVQWHNAEGLCASASTGGRKGWRVPTLSELLSLVDISRLGLALPVGHPFIQFYNDAYWTQTPVAAVPGNHFYVYFNDGTHGHAPNSSDATLRVLCARAGSGGLY